MEFKVIRDNRRCAGLSLPGMMVATGISSLVIYAVLSFFLYCNRSLVYLSNHVSLEQQNSRAMDILSKQLRQAKRLTSYSQTALALSDYDANTLQFVYDSAAQTFSRIKQGQTNILLTRCAALKFQIYSDDIQSNGFDVTSSATNVSQCKVISVSWTCTNGILGVCNYEPMQCAKILIRNTNSQ